MPIINDIRDTLSRTAKRKRGSGCALVARIRARTTWARFNVGAALTCCAVALGFYFWREIILHILNNL